MLSKIKKTYSNLGLTRLQRIELYLKNLEENIIIDDLPEKKLIEEIRELIGIRMKKLKRLYVLNTIFYFGIYFSFVSFFFSEFFLLGDLALLLGKVIGFFGTTVFFVGLFFSNKVQDLYYQDLQLLTAHLIAVFSKREFDGEENIFDQTNIYGAFLEFFKRRNF